MANNRFIRHIKIEADESGNLPSSVQLLHVGSWNTPWHGDFETTEGDIHEYVEHFQQGVGLPEENDGKAQINYSHKSHEKAAGWMSNLRAEEVGGVLSLVADVEWTPAGRQAIADEEFRYISPEFNPRALPWEDPEEEWRMVANVITGAALTNIPLFKKLKKVSASERPDSSKQIKKEGEPMKFKLEDVLKKEASAISADERAFLESKKSELSEEDLTKFDIKADETPADKQTKVEGDAAAQVQISASELATLKADAAKGVEAAQKLAQKEASDFVAARIAAGQIKSDQANDLTSILLASSSETREKLESFLQGLPANERLKANELGENGKEVTSDARADLHQKTVEKIKASAEDGKTLSYVEARKAVLSADSALAKRIKEEEEQ